MKKLIALILLFGAGSAYAVPVQWTFQDVVFDDGGTLTGSFVFDVDSTEVVEYATRWIQPFYFDFDVVASPGSGGAEFDSFWGDYRQPYAGEDLGYWTDPQPLPTADPADHQDGVSIFTETDCVITTCGRRMTLAFAAPLTNAGGTVALSGDEYQFTYCCAADYTRNIVSGTIFGARVIPIPAAVWLFGSGLGLLGWMRRRQTA